MADIPREVNALEQRLRDALGTQAASVRALYVRDVADRTRTLQFSNAMLHTAAYDPAQLQLHLDTNGVVLTSFREELRASRQALESAGAEESKQGMELQLNATVLQGCIHQARQSTDSALRGAEEDTRKACDALEAAHARLDERSRTSATLLTADLENELTSLRNDSQQMELRVKARAEDAKRANEQRARLADEFASLKETVDKHRGVDGHSASAMETEVRAMEEAQAARAADMHAALASEVTNVRRTAVAEAERLGAQLIARYRQETDATVDAMRSGAQARFQEVVDQAGHLVSQEFDAIMSTLDDKRRLNAERIARLREQLAMTTVQLDAVRRVVETSDRRPRQVPTPSSRSVMEFQLDSPPSAEAVQLQALKQAVRRLWQRYESTHGSVTAAEWRARASFLSEALRRSPYSAHVHNLLQQRMRASRDAAAKAAATDEARRAAMRGFADAAHRVTGGRATMDVSRLAAPSGADMGLHRYSADAPGAQHAWRENGSSAAATSLSRPSSRDSSVEGRAAAVDASTMRRTVHFAEEDARAVWASPSRSALHATARSNGAADESRSYVNDFASPGSQLLEELARTPLTAFGNDGRHRDVSPARDAGGWASPQQARQTGSGHGDGRAGRRVQPSEPSTTVGQEFAALLRSRLMAGGEAPSSPYTRLTTGTDVAAM